MRTSTATLATAEQLLIRATSLYPPRLSCNVAMHAQATLTARRSRFTQTQPLVTAGFGMLLSDPLCIFLPHQLSVYTPADYRASISLGQCVQNNPYDTYDHSTPPAPAPPPIPRPAAYAIVKRIKSGEAVGFKFTPPNLSEHLTDIGAPLWQVASILATCSRRLSKAIGHPR